MEIGNRLITHAAAAGCQRRGANNMRNNLGAQSIAYMNKGIAKSLLAATVLTAVALGSAAAAAQSPKTVKFQMDFVPQGLYAGFFYAKAKGYYAAENLNGELIAGKGSELAIEGVAN